MNVHFIAIGGSAMHNLAIALHHKGYKITGSDDEIFDPAKSRLERLGLLPETIGWNPANIHEGLDAVILGMHARADNPELAKAKELGLKIFSYPEYLYEQSKDKIRVVIGGSHGKTTITAMILHVLKQAGIDTDYMVGAQLEGFDVMVKLSEDARFMVFEGDEYLTSPIDRRPKFHLYMPDIAVINGIAWDHMNVFPTFENYVEQYRIFTEKITEKGLLIYFEHDEEVRKIAESARSDLKKIPYRVHGYFQNKTGFYAATHNRVIPMKIFGEHNMQNLSAAKEACLAAGVDEESFYDAISSFEGTSRRLQKIRENEKGIVYFDFAHAPSKVKATVEAVRARYPGRNIVACFELHTYSSLSRDFLSNYEGTLKGTAASFVYFNPHAIEMKKLKSLSKEDVISSFRDTTLNAYDNSDELFRHLGRTGLDNPVFLFMSSGDFDGHDITEVIN